MNRPFIAKALKKTPGFKEIDKLAEILDASYTVRGTADKDTQKTSFAPSSLYYESGRCARRWYYAFNGAEFIQRYDAYSLDNMQNGIDAHARIQTAFESSGLQVDVEVELLNEDPPIRSFCDLVLRDFYGRDIPVEIKTTRQEVFLHREANSRGAPYQELQLLTYMYIMNLDYGLLLYENKNDHRKLLVPVEMTTENRQLMDGVWEWCREVYAAYQNDLLPENVFRKNSKFCKNCPVQPTCFADAPGDIRILPLSIGDSK